MVENKKVITSKDIGMLFGLNSSFFQKSLSFLENEVKKDKKEFQEKYDLWNLFFHNIYGKDANIQLFLKHTYFALLLELFVINKLNMVISPKTTIFGEFEIYNWTKLSPTLLKDFNNKILDINLKKEDLFQELYQQIFFMITRHKIGEFYTFPNLAKKMVESLYKYGSKILDPSCGSGTFLIEIIRIILNSKGDIDSKIEAIKNVYGFDINPLAVLSSKVNLAFMIHDTIDSFDIHYLNNSIILIDSLFPENLINNNSFNLKKINNTFDLVIGNPPWLTYKDLNDKNYQNKIRNLSDTLKIKPTSQYITHIELASIFFYAIPSKFLKIGGSIFFVMTKSVLNGDHCYKFRLFPIFNNLEIWDFPKNYVFNVNHICLKAEFIGTKNKIPISEKYPIKTKLLDQNLHVTEEIFYDSFNIDEEGVKIILPEQDLKFLNEMRESEYKDKFFQGATLVPRTLVFFEVNQKLENTLSISSDQEVVKRSKKNWYHLFSNKEIEPQFRYKTFLNKDLIPFYIKKKRNVFLPITKDFKFDQKYFESFPKALKFYNEMNRVYKAKKKAASKIDSLIANINYWNKMSKQANNKKYIVVYNASGSKLKASVLINSKKNIIIGSDNYYYSTDSQEEAYYLSAILNTPELSRNIAIIKSSRHIHKRPFSFPIPLYNENNEIHRILAKKGKKYHFIVQDLVLNNPKINSEKVRIIINTKLAKLDNFFNRILVA